MLPRAACVRLTRLVCAGGPCCCFCFIIIIIIYSGQNQRKKNAIMHAYCARYNIKYYIIIKIMIVIIMPNRESRVRHRTRCGGARVKRLEFNILTFLLIFDYSRF